jgi:flavin-dependent dehydrogenase
MPAPQKVEIIGGGLAGLALGIALRDRQVPVILHEAGTYPRHRVCGEFLTGWKIGPSGLPGLDAILSTALPARAVTWLEPGRPGLRHTLPEPALCISRHHLDLELARLFVHSGGELRTGSRTAPDPQPGRVLACGRRPDPSSPWVGRKEHFLGLELTDDLELHLGTNAYVGLTHVGRGTVNVCGLFPRSRRKTTLAMQARDCGLADLADRLAAATPVEGSACAVAGLAYRRAADNSPAVSLGDHRDLIPPFTGHGMTIALQSAATAAPHLATWAMGGTTWDEASRRMEKDFTRRFGRRIRWGQRLHPWLLDPARRRLPQTMARLRLLPLGALYRLLH